MLYVDLSPPSLFFFFFNDTATTEIYTLSLHDALPICLCVPRSDKSTRESLLILHHDIQNHRSEEHTSELQSQSNLVCRLLLEKKKKRQTAAQPTTLNVPQTSTQSETSTTSHRCMCIAS